MLSLSNQGVLRVIILGIAVVITAGSLWYSNILVRRLAQEEEKKVQLFAAAMEFVGTVDLDCQIPQGCPDSCAVSLDCETNFVYDNITRDNELIPTLLVDEDGTINGAVNIPGVSGQIPEDSVAIVKAYLDKLKSKGSHKPIEISFFGKRNYVWYDESSILKQLRIFPYLQFAVIGIFILIVFAAFSVAKKNEQNKVWVGLAKETAHQLGTPVSSLMAWAELLKLKFGEKPEDLELINELQKDIARLEVVTERFSKIGSKPELKEVALTEVLTTSAEYIAQRMSRQITLRVENQLPDEAMVRINPPLFQWVIENLLKNALDAMESNKGSIVIHASASTNEYFIDIEDSGKGIPRSQFNQVFQPGFTTKKRGWGLGLSLTRRIVESYHNGKIFVKNSEVGKGTTFRIVLKK